jgi:hypothetical protein
MAADYRTILANLANEKAALAKANVPAAAKANLIKKLDVALADVKSRVAEEDKVAKQIADFKAKQKQANTALVEFKKKLPPAYQHASDALTFLNTLRGPKADPVVGKLFNDLSALVAKGINTGLSLGDDK